MFECDKIDERMRQVFETKRQENYSQGYYFAIGLLKQLCDQEFTPVTDESNTSITSSTSFSEKWLKFSNDFKYNSGEDSQAKWDVFAECFMRIPLEEQARFVDYTKVEVELVTDLVDDADTLNNDSKRGNGPPDILLNDQVQLITLIESQIDSMKQAFQEKLTQS